MSKRRVLILLPVEAVLFVFGPLTLSRLTLFTPDGQDTYTVWTLAISRIGAVSVRPPDWTFRLAERLGHAPRALSKDELQGLRGEQPW
jgi:hypothetical protein